MRIDRLDVNPNRALWRVRAAHDGEAETFGAVALLELGLADRESISTAGQRAELALFRIIFVLFHRRFFIHIRQFLTVVDVVFRLKRRRR